MRDMEDCFLARCQHGNRGMALRYAYFSLTGRSERMRSVRGSAGLMPTGTHSPFKLSYSGEALMITRSRLPGCACFSRDCSALPPHRLLARSGAGHIRAGKAAFRPPEAWAPAGGVGGRHAHHALIPGQYEWWYFDAHLDDGSVVGHRVLHALDGRHRFPGRAACHRQPDRPGRHEAQPG